jgi:hypothetical protein
MGGLRIWRKAEQAARSHQEVRVVFGQMARELRNAVSFPGDSFVGKEDEISFHTRVMSPGGSAVPRIIKVIYRLAPAVGSDAGLSDGMVLRRVERVRAPEGSGGLETTRDITECQTRVRFEFASLPGSGGGPFHWETVWGNAKEFPAGVRMWLTQKDPAEPGRENVYVKTLSLPVGLTLAAQ